jgi:adenylyltransferase/sulfurtransferase
MEGQIASYVPASDGPCYQCLYKQEFENTETCAIEGVLSPVVGVIGTMQALETILILIGQEDSVNGKLLLFDGLSMEWQKVQIPKNPDCTVCGN